MIAAKVRYLSRCIVQQLFSSKCTNCGSEKFFTVDRKYLVTSLRRCEACELMYRAPPDGERQNYKFYQMAYRQGFTTELPDKLTLQKHIATKFADIGSAYGTYISVLSQLGLAPGARIFDYGCSWGYGSWQLMDHGYRVSAYEIAKHRAEFARSELGVDCSSEDSEQIFQSVPANSFDCVFSAHVLEHVPSPARVIAFARLALKPGGIFVAFTPNGCDALRNRDPLTWHRLWGEAHPNLIDDQYYRRALGINNTYFDSSPFCSEGLAKFRAGEAYTSVDMSGYELLCVARF